MDHQHHLFISIIAIFISLGIGILVGASISESTLVENQIAIIEELQEELSYKEEEISNKLHEIALLEKERKTWRELEEKYITPMLIEDNLKDFEVILISEEKPVPGLVEFLELSGTRYHQVIFKNKGYEQVRSWEELQHYEAENVATLMGEELHKLALGEKNISDTSVLNNLKQEEFISYNLQRSSSSPNEESKYFFIFNGESFLLKEIIEVMVDYNNANIFWIDPCEETVENNFIALSPSILQKNGVDTLWERLHFISYLQELN